MDAKVMPIAHKEALLAALTDDFYYFEEIRNIYVELIPDADPESVNPYNLTSMGFTVLSRYALRNWSSLEAYFKHFLLCDAVVDIAPLRKRFSCIQMWYQTLTNLKKEYEILEFEPDQIINIRKLEDSGVTKQMLKGFCDEVYAFLEDGTYFTAKSLRQSGFCSDLYDLGFSDWFYANLLCFDPRFSYCGMLSGIVLHKGKEGISIKSFLTDQIRRAGTIDILDLISDLQEDFGLRVEMKSDITQKLHDSEVFYDPILERLYADAELYYRELDEDTEGM